MLHNTSQESSKPEAFITMKNKPTQADVAKLAGVSRATVSYVINNVESKNAIPEETAQRVRQVIETLGYVPNQQALHLKRQATDRICVVLPRLGVPFNDLLLHGLRSTISEFGYSIFITVGDTEDSIIQLLKQVRGGLVDGVFMMLDYGNIADEQQILNQLHGIGVPMVLQADLTPTPDYDTTWTTEREATYEAIRFLIQKGHRRIAFLGHDLINIESYGRYQEYIQAHMDHDLPVHQNLIIPGNSTRDHAYHSVLRLLREDKPPTAIFCTADIIAITSMVAIQKFGLSIPNDIVVVGCGNILEAEYAMPSLTTIGPPQHSYDEVAALLVQRLTATTQPPPQRITQRWQLIVREST